MASLVCCVGLLLFWSLVRHLVGVAVEADNSNPGGGIVCLPIAGSTGKGGLHKGEVQTLGDYGRYCESFRAVGMVVLAETQTMS